MFRGFDGGQSWATYRILIVLFSFLVGLLLRWKYNTNIIHNQSTMSTTNVISKPITSTTNIVSKPSFTCDGKIIIPGQTSHSDSPAENRSQSCLKFSNGELRMSSFTGQWIQNYSVDRVASYWAMSCPFEIRSYSCASSEGKFGNQHALYSRSLRFNPRGCQLDSFDRQRFVTYLNGRHLEFFGDSMTRQHFISVLCHLLPYVDWSATNRFWGRNHHDVHAPGCGKDVTAPKSSDKWPCHQRYHGVMVNPHRANNTACIFLTTGSRVCYRGFLSHFVNQYMNHFNNNVLIVANAGLHGGTNDYRIVLENFVTKYEAIEKSKRPFVVYREHAAQHFKGRRDGSFQKRVHVNKGNAGSNLPLDVPCQASIDNGPTDSRVRYEEQVVSRAKIPILLTYEATKATGCAHIGTQSTGIVDCTHFCLPGVPDNWTELLFNFLAGGFLWDINTTASTSLQQLHITRRTKPIVQLWRFVSTFQ